MPGAGRRPLLPPLRRAAGARELLDGPAPAPELARCLADVARLNALFGGRLLTLVHVRRLLGRLPPGRPATVLDAGTGGADVPRALVRWARRTGRALQVLAVDQDPAVLEIAARAVAGYDEIRLLRADALALPLPSGAVDVAASSLLLHHLEPAEAVRHLREMDRVARLGTVVNDLGRSRAGYALVWLATRVLARSPMSRHDGPLSVRRAYTPAELRGLYARAGLAGVRVRRYGPLARLVAVRRREGRP